MELKFLGGLTIQQDGEPLTELKSKKGQALVCYLALNRKPVTRPYLAALFWPDVPDTNAFSNLRKTLQRLKPLAGYLLIDHETVGINPDADFWLDVTEFEKGTTASALSSANSPNDIPRLQTAVALYQGDFLDGFILPDTPMFEEWVLAQRARLREKALAALHYLVSHFREQHDFGTALKYARHRLTLEPWHEETHRSLMELLALSGHRSEALVQFETCRRVLADELDVEPSAATMALYERIKAGEYEQTPEAQKAPDRFPDPEDIPRHNLPIQATPFIGRFEELATLDNLLGDQQVRLVTILGPGGMGKTRLALEAAERQVEKGEFVDGVYFVLLAAISDDSHIVPAITSAMRFSLEGDSDPKRQLLTLLRSQQLLLVLDNFEHLLEGVELIAEILQTAPGVKILVTSRERLLLHGEQVYPIEGLVFPEEDTVTENLADFSAVQLFLQSARRVRQNFEIDAKEYLHLIRICHLVAGMPLGIELAAAWVEFLSLAEIEREIRRNLDFLETELRDVPERHRSMRAVFEGSWQRMSQDEQAIFIRLSVFRGGFTRGAAEEVAGATFRQLGRLVFKSLLQFDQKKKRYQLHELLRQFGAEKLAEDKAVETAVRSKHSEYFCSLLNARADDLKSSGVLEAMAEISNDIDNVRKAWNTAVEQGQIERIGTAVEGLAWYYFWRGRHREAFVTMQPVARQLEKETAETSNLNNPQYILLAYLCCWLARFEYELGNFGQYRALCGRAIEILERPEFADQDIHREKAFAYYSAGFNKNKDNYLDKSLALYRELNDQWGIILASARLGMYSNNFQGDYQRSERFYNEAIRLNEILGHPLQAVWNWSECGYVIVTQGRYDEGLALLQRAIESSLEIEYWPGFIGALYPLALLATRQGAFLKANEYYSEILEQIQKNRVVMNIYFEVAQRHQYWIRLHEGDYQATHNDILANLKIIPPDKEYWSAPFYNFLAGCSYLVLGQKDKAHKHFQTGIQWMKEQGGEEEQLYRELQCVLTFTIMDKDETNRQQAKKYIADVFTWGNDLRYTEQMLMALCAVAYLFAVTGKSERAVEMYALAREHRFVSNSRWFEDVVGRPIAEMTANLSPAVVTAAKERGRQRDLRQTAESLLTELAELGRTRK